MNLTRWRFSRRAGLGLFATAVFAQSPDPPKPAAAKRGPALSGDRVKEFVIAGHAKLDRVQALLAEHPGLLNAAWDWGEGDFETALGGASHMGYREGALFLVEKGARVDIFAAAMLGYVDVVKAMVKACPGIEKSLGPHKIPLLAHAQKGGTPAEAVLTYLQTLK
jgi:hypothetical protein